MSIKSSKPSDIHEIDEVDKNEEATIDAS